MILYHGSNVGVEDPQLMPLARALDFGRAFYLTSDREQAVKWARTTTLRKGVGLPVVSSFEVDDAELNAMRCIHFEGPTGEWLRFISKHRNEGHDESGADVVSGPVANDNTMPVLNLYFKGAYTEEEALRRLLPQRLRDQYAFKTERAIAALSFVREERV